MVRKCEQLHSRGVYHNYKEARERPRNEVKTTSRGTEEGRVCDTSAECSKCARDTSCCLFGRYDALRSMVRTANGRLLIRVLTSATASLSTKPLSGRPSVNPALRRKSRRGLTLGVRNLLYMKSHSERLAAHSSFSVLICTEASCELGRHTHTGKDTPHLQRLCPSQSARDTPRKVGRLHQLTSSHPLNI
jgi:hypothetical protein